MKPVLSWLWKQGIVSTFLAGFFVVLPIAITIGIMSWVGTTLVEWFGPRSVVGRAFAYLGLPYNVSSHVANVVGWIVVLAVIWLLGVYVKSKGRRQVEQGLNAAIERIPLVNFLYRPVVQVVEMFNRDDEDEMKGMSVVYCAFGKDHGGGFLGLLVSHDVYRFAGQEYHVVYVPTSPVPMSGGVVFVPTTAVEKVDMEVEDLMQIYFSIGVMSAKVIPPQYVVPADAAESP